MNSIIVIGGGRSLRGPITDGLWNVLDGAFTIGCNYIYLEYTPTVLAFIDDHAYTMFFTKARNLPIAVCRDTCRLPPYPNLHRFALSPEYHGVDSLRMNKVYCHNFSGLFAVTVAICFRPDVVYMLGFDGYKKPGPQEFYPDYVPQMSADKVARNAVRYDLPALVHPYLADPQVRLINVGLDSELNCPDVQPLMPTIGYPEFLDRARSGDLRSSWHDEGVRGFLCNPERGFSWA